ncbi:MAG TPA: rod shape-determining protein MreC [Coxiellaceae bacterium]|nr:rod shape-determining protein MreC [Coxiellaceae bacterium]
MQTIFKRSPWFGLRVIVLMLFSFALMVMDHQWNRFHQLRAFLSVIVLPIQYTVSTPFKIFSWLKNSAMSQQQLVSENAELRAHQLLLSAQLQRMLILKQENTQLKQLLHSGHYVKEKMMIASLLSVETNPHSQTILLNRGTNRHVFQGQPVLDGYGVMGQVVEVEPYTSRVLLITDPQSAVPVQNYRNGLRAIAVGKGPAPELTLLYVPETSDIQVGDLYVTSGLDGIYPAGYPVGKVTYFGREKSSRFAEVILSPAAHINSTQHVILLSPKSHVPSTAGGKPDA